MTESATGGDELQRFDRRRSDANWTGLAQRVTALEDRMEVFENDLRDNTRELKANTSLTKQVHETVLGDGGEIPGVTGKVDQMYELFDSTRKGFQMIEAVGGFGLKVIETGGKVARPLVWIAALGAAAYGFVKTGSWQLPGWLK